MKSCWPQAVADMKANEGILYVIDIVPDSPETDELKTGSKVSISDNV